MATVMIALNARRTAIAQFTVNAMKRTEATATNATAMALASAIAADAATTDCWIWWIA
jgi:hypothetical protein